MASAVLQKACRRADDRLAYHDEAANDRFSGFSYTAFDIVVRYITGTDDASAFVTPLTDVIRRLEEVSFTALSEASFAQDWNSDEDAIYDDV